MASEEFVSKDGRFAEHLRNQRGDAQDFEVGDRVVAKSVYGRVTSVTSGGVVHVRWDGSDFKEPLPYSTRQAKAMGMERVPVGAEFNEFPQLPGVVLGVAYEDAMGGVSVDVIDDGLNADEVLEDYTDPELCAIVPLATMGDIAKVQHADELHEALAAMVEAIDESEMSIPVALAYEKAQLVLAKVHRDTKAGE